MPQNGVHAIAGMAARKWMPHREWLLLGVVLGNMFPDLDNLAVAFATLARVDTHGLHRTFSHSLFTVIAVVLLFYLIAALAKNRRWSNLGLGLGIGILMHILLDLVLWFNGVELLWPIRYELNFWNWFSVPDWLEMIVDTAEFLAFGLYFLLLSSVARRRNTDTERQASARVWAYIEFVLFAIFTVLFFSAGAEGLPYMVSGALYLISALAAIFITLRMRKTVETLS